MQDLIARMASPQSLTALTWVWCAGCILLFLVVFTWHLLWHVYRTTRAFARATKQLRKASGGSEQLSRTTAARIFRQGSSQSVRWEMFRESWFNSVPDGASEGALDPADYFSPAKELGGLNYLKKLEGWPGRFLTLGILGTFVGITLGLSGLDLDGSTGDANELFASVKQLTQGLSIAFLTSIVGIICSLSFLYFERQFVAAAYQRVEEFNETVRARYRSTPPEAVLLRLATAATNSADSLRTLENDLAATLSESFGEAMTAHLAPMIEKLQNSLDSVTSTSARAQLEGVERIVLKFIEGMDERLGEKFGKLGQDIEGASENLSALSTAMSSVADAQRQILDRTSATAKVLEGQLPHLISFGERLEHSANVFIQAIARVDEMEGRLSAASQQLIELQKATEGRFETTIQRLADLGELLKATSIAQSESQRRMEAAYKEALDSFESNLRGGLVGSLKSFDSILGGVLERFSGTLADLREQYSAVERHAAALQESVSQNSASLASSLTKLGEVSTQAHAQLNQLFQDHMRNATLGLEANTTSVSALQENVAALRATSEGLTDLFERVVSASTAYQEKAARVILQTEASMNKSTESSIAAVEGLKNGVEFVGETFATFEARLEELMRKANSKPAESTSDGGGGRRRLFGRKGK